MLASDLGIVTVNVFDTAKAFQYLQHMPEMIKRQENCQSNMNLHSNPISLEKLVKLLLEIELDKFF